MVELGVPWWTYRAIDEVEDWLAARSTPARVYEYGSGASTVWLAHRAGEIHSVEHDSGFGELVSRMVSKLPNAQLRVVPAVPASSPAVGSQKEGHANLDFSDYVSSIDAVAGTFDLVIVDGRAREACLRAALPRLGPEGLVVFDNSRRRRYRDAIAAAPVSESVFAGLTPTLPYPDQTSLLRPLG
jgi:predicted O-methyltransferase YrrM